jgi:ABC-type dipeptide/oligopeptide/nickel transport system permease subunit
MAKSNPDRFASSADSPLQSGPPSKLSMTQIFNVCCKGSLTGVFAGVVVGGFVDLEIIPAVLLISLFVLIPIALFGITFYRSRDSVVSQICFWLGAAPLAIYFVMLMFNQGSDAGVVQEIGQWGLIGYFLQLFPAALILHFLSLKELANAQNIETQHADGNS